MRDEIAGRLLGKGWGLGGVRVGLQLGESGVMVSL